jgi:[ribosomal protein S18]-alanine N-acetyltransferase
MLIRTAVPDDIPQIMSLAQQSKTAAHWSARQYDALFAADAPERVALVAIEESRPAAVAGFVIVRCGDEEWEIENVVVDEGTRRQGIGGLLIREVLHHARRRGVASVLLEVRESNLAARALYNRLGFTEQGRRSKYYREPDEDALLLQVSV